MRALKIAAIVATLALIVTGSPALAASGTYTSDYGQSCSWFGFGSSYSIDCSGYSRRAGQYVSYHCDVDNFGSSYSYRCRSMDGSTWSGSR